MEFSTDARTDGLRKELVDFMYGHVYPAEAAYLDELDSSRTASRGRSRPSCRS